MAAVVIQQNNAPQRVPWNNTFLDMCGSPGGCGTCMYVFFCPNCAAGDVARYAGRSYCMSCCVMPAFAAPGVPCFWACDRDAFVARYGINENPGCAPHCVKLYFCPCCSLIQTLNHAAAQIQKGTAPNQGNGGQTIVVVAQAPQQPQMVAAPVAYTGAPAAYAGSA